jgi:phosphatidylglycerol:prolipoprotein diacylglycerol transferase
MHPILFEIPGLGFPIRSFGLMVAVGFLVGSFVLQKLAARHDPDNAGADAATREERAARYGGVVVWVIVGVLAGARAMYVIVEMARGTWEPETPFDVFAIWKGGLAMYGGLFGGIVAGLWGAKRAGIRPIPALDLGLVATFFGLCLGRIGCYLVGDDYGAVVPEKYASLPFPITLRVPAELPEQSLFGSENAGQLLWATQIWMATGAFLLGLLGLFLIERRRYFGQTALQLVLAYALVRGTIEHFRGDEVRGVWFGGALSTSQMIALVTGTIALVLLVRLRHRREPALAARGAGARS